MQIPLYQLVKSIVLFNDVVGKWVSLKKKKCLNHLNGIEKKILIKSPVMKRQATLIVFYYGFN